MDATLEALTKKVDELFPSMSSKLQALSDAASVCQRPLWTASAASRIEYGKVLPDVFDKETAMWLRALATFYIFNYNSQLLEAEEETYKSLEQKLVKKIEALKTDRDLLENYSQHTVLTGDLATGKVNRTLVSGYKAPDSIRSLITLIRLNGKFPSTSQRFNLFIEDHRNAKLENLWEEERSLWASFLEESKSIASWTEELKWSFRRAVYTAWVVYNEVRLHQAEMTILSHQIMKSKDDEVRKVAKLLQQPSATGFKSADEAKKWMDEHRNEIAEMKKFLRLQDTL